MLYLSIGVVTLFMASQQKDCPQDTVPGNVGELNDGSTHSFYPCLFRSLVAESYLKIY